MTAGPEPTEQPTLGGQPNPGAPLPPGPYETPTTPLEVAPVPTATAAPPTHATQVQPTLASAAGEQCPSCGAHMATDQRYCLECGHRRGDPRLPFMDAVVFMDAVKRPGQAATAPPSPPSRSRPRISANASLIAGVGTLLLALGIGVLIGKTGEGGSSNAASGTPQIIKVGGGAETASTAAGEEAGGAAKKGKGGSGASKKAAKAKSETGSSGTTKGVEEVLKPSSGVKFAPPTVQKGGSCEEGTAGCDGGKFSGEFFGE